MNVSIVTMEYNETVIRVAFDKPIGLLPTKRGVNKKYWVIPRTMALFLREFCYEAQIGVNARHHQMLLDSEYKSREKA